MSDSQRFSVAAHVLAYLAHKDAVCPASVQTNPVVMRRVTAMLITLDKVLRADNGGAHLGAPTAVARGCPISEHIPRAVDRAIQAADGAATEHLFPLQGADPGAPVAA